MNKLEGVGLTDWNHPGDSGLFLEIEYDGSGGRALQRPAAARRGGLSGLRRIGRNPLSVEPNRAKLSRKYFIYLYLESIFIPAHIIYHLEKNV